MRILTIVTLLIFAVAFSVLAGRAPGSYPGYAPSERLEAYAGKYPSQLLKGVPSLKHRLRILLGPNYNLFMQRLQTEMPIENTEGALVGRGCMAHSCGQEEAVFAINLSDGKLHCAILSQKYGGKFRVFSEDKAHLPTALKRAIQQT